MSKNVPPIEKLKALCALSEVAEPADNFQHFFSEVKQAPDPETAIQSILNNLPIKSASANLLKDKWRNVITDVWSDSHPSVPLLHELSLTTADLATSPILADTHAYLEELLCRPALLVKDGGEWVIDPADVLRLSRALPSVTDEHLHEVENEWAYLPLRRLRGTLQAARLVRPWKGAIYPVQSRLKQFKRLPASHQAYILWHSDIYHLDWSRFASMWEGHLKLVQEFSTTLWQTLNWPTEGLTEDRHHWSLNLIESFWQVWEDQGMLDIHSLNQVALKIVQQHALPNIIDRVVLRDLLERHGLVTITEEFGSFSKFTWTRVGEQLIAAESTGSLPCSTKLLK